MTSETTIQRASQLPGEADLLSALCRKLSEFDRYLVYADWLEEHGDAGRAEFIREYVAALESGTDFPARQNFSEPWLRIIGFRLANACCERGLAEERMTLLNLARPSLQFERSFLSEPLTEDTFPIGASKQFGIPDLPAGTSWPTQKDCRSRYVNDSGIDPDTLCSFVAQVNCEDLAETQLESYFPKTGLISIFSCGEFESIGMIDGCVIFTPETSTLQRMQPPEDLVGPDADEANQLAEPAPFGFVESLEVPWAGEESPFEQIQWSYDDDRHDKFVESIEAAGCESLSSLGGFTQSTSGDDPLPGADWCKLICLMNSTESTLHFCIRYDDLAAGNFDDVRLAWVDFD